MKSYSLLILFFFLQTLICDEAGVTQKSLQDALITSLPYIKSFHQKSFHLLGDETLMYVNLYTTPINSNNVQFIIDENRILHIKFINVKGELKGYTYSQDKKRIFRSISPFTMELNNISLEEKYSIESTKKNDGKYDVKFKSIDIDNSSVSYNIIKFTMKNYSEDSELFTRSKIKYLNFNPFKQYLQKISELILETLQNKLK
jgi:hypothetical protein